jgi:hypothetical protein
MELQEIHEELDRIGKMDSIDFNEFLSLLYDYPRVLVLRKDLVNYGFEVVGPQLFFSKVVDEIPDLKSTNFRKWSFFEMQDENFLVVTTFSESLDSYQQKIFLFNESEELEFLTDIESPLSFYSNNSSYLESLPIAFDNAFIGNLETNLTQPMLFQVFKKHVNTLLSNGEHKKATVFLANRKKFIDNESAEKLKNRINNGFDEWNLYCETKSDILQLLVDDQFNEARRVLKNQFSNLNSGSYEDLEDLIRKNENAYERVIELRDQAEVAEAKELVDQINRDKQAAIEKLEHDRKMFDLEEREYKSRINTREEMIQLKQEELRQNRDINEKKLEMEQKKLNALNENKGYRCRYCQQSAYNGRPEVSGCKESKLGQHLWVKHT